MTDRSADLQYLLDDRAIRNVHIRYCRGIDRMDWELVRSCFHSDSQQNYGDYRGGVDGFIDYAKNGEFFQFTQHFIGNQSVEIAGDRAWTESYTYAFHIVSPIGDAPAMEWNMNLRYVDTLERREGEWRIVDRVMVFDAMTSRPAQQEFPEFIGEFNKGLRNSSDISYVKRSAL